jgi:sulfide:quinone oxidoreductase
MKKHVLILGAGFGGLELATQLSENLAEEVVVTLIDRSDSFMFGFSKFDIMFGRQATESMRMYYRDFVRKDVDLRHETVTSIDPESRGVVTDRGSYEADILVIALGADYDHAATPGFVDGGHDYYTIAGSERLRDLLPTFTAGRVLIAVLGLPFKCPPAPYEGAILLHDFFVQRGVRGEIEMLLLTPEERPVPVSDQVSNAIAGAVAERGIDARFKELVVGIDPDTRTAMTNSGDTIAYDLFIGIPIHRVPDVVEASGVAVDGWIPVDQTNLATRFPNVYALGDVASAPVPRAGVFAERSAVAVAQDIRAKLEGTPAEPFDGAGICYIEFGRGLVGKVDANFLGGRDPVGIFIDPSHQGADEKAEFGASRRRRWFGG